jgi:hypothetical protein
MKLDFSPRLFYEGFGNIDYQTPGAKLPPIILTGAVDGLSVEPATPNLARLGQDVGQAGNPAQFTEERQIPFNGFALLLDQISQAAGGHLILKYTAAPGFDPQIEFQDSTGATLATIRIDPTGLGIYIGNNNGTTATGRQNVSIGDNTMSRCTTTRDTVAIGAQAGSGAGVVTPSEKNVFIGADNSDLGIGFDTGSDGVFIGANTNDNGVRNVGNASIWLGSFINNGATVLAGDTGANTILIGTQIGTGGNATNLTIIGNLITSLLSNLVLLGRFDQNVVIGAALAGETDDGNKLQVRGNFDSKGIAQPIRTTAVAAENFGANDYTILCNTAAGSITVTIDPTTRVGKIGNVKKISADVNSVTLTAASGLIFDIGAGTASVSFNTQGESLQFQSDGTNIYII